MCDVGTGEGADGGGVWGEGEGLCTHTDDATCVGGGGAM